MRKILFTILPVPLLFAAVYAVMQLHSGLILRGADRQVKQYRAALRMQSTRTEEETAGLPKNDVGQLRAIETEEREALDISSDAASAWGAEAKAHANFGSLLRLKAENTPAVDRIHTFCEALSQFGQALLQAPRDAQLLMSWGNIRQILGNTDCQLPYTEGRYQEAIAEALKKDPTNMQTKYAAGLILLWGKEKPTAWRLFHEVLRYSTTLTQRQLSSILTHLDSPEALRAVVPTRFPQVLQVSAYFDQNPPAFANSDVEKKAFKEALADLQIAAVGESATSFEQDAIPYDVHFARLQQLINFATAPQTRKLLDRELSTLVRRKGEQGLSDYLAERARLEELTLLRATLAGDTRPAKTPLVGWGGNETIAFDEFYRSIGFFLAKNQTVRSLELSFANDPAAGVLSALKVFCSNDNANWLEVTPQMKIESFELGAQSLIVLRTAGKSERYWKVNFSNAGKERRLINIVPKVIRAFGNALGDK